MYLLVGLGNPESGYKGTRHNIGFEVINKLAYDYNINIDKSKHKAHIGVGSIINKKVILVKPQTYMNLSGQSVKEVINYYNINIKDIIVLYDEIAVDLGEIKIKSKGSAGGHNGVKSVIQCLGTDEFLRIRIGIGERPKHMVLSDYVLSRFTNVEFESMANGVTKAGEAVELIIKDSVSSAMNKYNVKKNMNKNI